MQSEIKSSLWVVVGVLILCVTSKMAWPESQQGQLGKAQIKETLNKLQKDVKFYQSMSRQDNESIMALVHNAEALGLLRAMKYLSDCYNIDSRYTDLEHALISDRDKILRHRT